MNTIPSHATWCDSTAQEHAVCRWPVTVVEFSGGETVTVGLHKARGVAGIITVVHRIGGREHLIALGPTAARTLAAGLSVAVDMLA